MSESKPEIKDLFGISRGPGYVQVEGETVPVLEALALQAVTNQTVNTSRAVSFILMSCRQVTTLVSVMCKKQENKNIVHG
jgi:hypothetical protein